MILPTFTHIMLLKFDSSKGATSMESLETRPGSANAFPNDKTEFPCRKNRYLDDLICLRVPLFRTG